MIELQFGLKLKFVQSDDIGEFKPLVHFLENEGLIYHWMCLHSSEQNGMVESHHYRVVGMGLTLLLHSGALKHFWMYVFHTVVFILNCVHSHVFSLNFPYFLLYQRKTDFHSLKIFGSLCVSCIKPYSKRIN